MGNLITVTQAAERLSLHRTRVHALIKAGKLPATRTGSVLLINDDDLALVADRKPGRPPMTEEEKAEKAKEAAGVSTEPKKTKKAPTAAKKAGKKSATKK